MKFWVIFKHLIFLTNNIFKHFLDEKGKYNLIYFLPLL
jgi:hypothetical protein